MNTTEVKISTLQDMQKRCRPDRGQKMTFTTKQILLAKMWSAHQRFAPTEHDDKVRRDLEAETGMPIAKLVATLNKTRRCAS